MSEEILLNRMYAGNYLNDDYNIGHEVINLFKDDKGRNYIYVMSAGDYGPKHFGKIKDILLVRGINQHCLEILAKANNLEPVLKFPPKYTAYNHLSKQNKESKEKVEMRHNINKEQKEYIDKENITYGGIKLYNIYKNNITEYRNMSIYITFKANNFKLPKKPIYLVNKESKNENEFYIKRKRLSGQALCTYCSSDTDKDNYKILKDIINNTALWNKENNSQQIPKEYNNDDGKQFFLKILRKEYDELAYSNMFEYFLSSDKNLFKKFLTTILKINSKGNITIKRELKNIDILIYDDFNVIVIENKIKSGINGKKYDIYGKYQQNQLDKYKKYIEKNFKDKKHYFYIFAPNYNHLSNEKSLKDYKVINYEKLYKFFEKEKDNVNIYKPYYDEFLKALEIHTKPINNNHFEIMLERMIKTIKVIKK